MPKKAPYVYFCQEQSRVDPKLCGKSLQELVSVCSESWSQLDSDKRQPYVDMSKGVGRHSSSSHRPPPKKLDCLRRPLSSLVQEERDREAHFRRIRRDIHNRAGSAERASFHFLDVTDWVTTLEGRSIPLEVALVVLSLSGGVSQRWNAKIHPGVPPLGYRGEMMKNSEGGHGLWVDKREELNTNYSGILSQLKNLLTPKAKEAPAVDSRLLPVFVASNALEKVKTAMEWLVLAAGEDLCEENAIVPYESHVLLWDLVSLSPYKAAELKIPSINMAKAHLERDTLPNMEEASCEFHNLTDNLECSLLKATRMAFIVAEFCCLSYDLEAVEGRHYPSGSNRLPSRRLNSSVLNFSFGSDTLNSSNMKVPPLDPSVSFEDLEDQDAHPLKPFLDLHKFRNYEELMLNNGGCNTSIFDNVFSLTSKGELDDASEVSSLYTINSDFTYTTFD